MTPCGERQALIILVGITADKTKRRAVCRFFSEKSPYDVYVPKLPQRLGLRWCAKWLQRHLTRSVRIQNYSTVHVLSYISGGMVFRLLASHSVIGGLSRIVYIRGPIQERVPSALIDRYGRFGIWILQGRMVLDLAEDWLERLPFPPSSAEQGLVIETGTSQLARSLGIASRDVPAECWSADRLLPGASDCLVIPLSHDDVYTSDECLSSVLSFLQQGSFGRAGQRDARS